MLPRNGAGRGVMGAAAAVLVLALANSQPAAAVVSSDTLARSECNSTAQSRLVTRSDEGYYDDSQTDAWAVTREVELTATGRGSKRRLNLAFYGMREGEDPQPAVARSFFYNQGDEGYPMTRQTTVGGESSVAVRLHLGDARTISLGVFTPAWEAESGHNVVGYGFGRGVGSWWLSISLRKHLKKLRAHEYKAKGSRSRVSLTYKFPATQFVRHEEWDYNGRWYGTETTAWSPAECSLRSRRLRLTTRPKRRAR